MKHYLVKDQDGNISKLHSKVDPSTILPYGWSLVPEEEKDAAEAQHQANKLNEARTEILNKIRKTRDEKLKRADILMNVAYLNSWTVAERNELKNYRQALLDITNSYKADTSSLDNLDPSSIVWPTEPSEA